MSYPESLEKTPTKTLEYYWADYIELLCLANPDKAITKSDFINRVRNRNKDFQDPLEDDLFADYESLKEESNDKWTTRTNDYFQFLVCREKIFGDYYPFELSIDKKLLKVKTPLSEKQKLYLFLLFASNLKYFKNKIQTLTGSFERICVAATKTFFQGWDIHSFGAGAEVDSKYEGTLWQKINLLITDLCGKLIAEEKDFPPNNRGDGGLDIVGWKQFSDKKDGFPILFGQCACTKSWETKQHSSNQEVWDERIKTKAPPLNLIYAPICFRNASGQWYRSDQIRKSILLDRLRLKEILIDMDAFKNSNSYDVVNELILMEENVI